MAIIRQRRNEQLAHEQSSVAPSGYHSFARANPDFIAEIGEISAEWQRWLERLRRRPKAAQHHDVRRMLRSRRMHSFFAFNALRKLRRLGGAQVADVHALASRFDPFSPVVGESVLTREVGTRPRTRFVQDFGPVRRMHQFAIDHILRSLHPPRESQKLFNGGMPMALVAIEDAYRNGATHSCEVDFINFYGSVRWDGLANLMRPLPQSVTRHVVWDDALREQLLSIGPASCPTPEAPTGLSLGSATSPIVGEVIIDRLLAAAQLTDVVTYADNLIVFGRSGDEVSARVELLRAGIASADFGASGLRLKNGDVSQIEEVVSFANHLGHINKGGTFEWGPGYRRQNDFKISEAGYVTVAQLETAMSQVANWRRYYANWSEGDRHEAEYLAGLKARRYIEEPSGINLTEAVSALTEAHLLTGEAPGVWVPDTGTPAGRRRRQEILERLAQRLSALNMARERRRSLALHTEPNGDLLGDR